MDRQMSYLIIGNGITGVTAAEVFRSEDPTCKLTIIAEEPFPVYYRPALKDYLAGRIVEDKLWARPATFYRQQQIRFVPGHVVGIDSVQQIVQLHDGQQKRYDKLLLASGACPGQLNCLGLHLAGVSTLRTVEDYQQLRQRLAHARRIVVCGSGTLALETAETLKHQGYQVTHLLRKRTLWSEVLDSTASDLVLQEERRSGIDVHLEEEITEIAGKNGQVVGVNTTLGAYIPCEIVIIAIGIEPLTDFAKASGIACGRGIKVDAAMRTNTRNIYAAGDVVETTNSKTGTTRIIGQWYPAIHQAHRAAYSMLDRLNPQQPASTDTFYNATFLFGLDFVSIGETITEARSPYQEYRAEPKPRTYRKLLLQHGVPVGALFLGNRKNALAFKRAIDHRVNLSSVINSIFAEDFELDSWLDIQSIPPANIDTGDLAAIALEGSTKSLSPIYIQTTPLATPKSARAGAILMPVAHPHVRVALKEEQLHLGQEDGVITIGRQQGAQTHIEHASISRQHAEITCWQGRYRLRDVGSANGTFVNNVKLPPYTVRILQQNDRIRFGDVQFDFQQQEAEKKKAESFLVEGLAHRVDAYPLSKQRIRFEIDMCIGCNRCMSACPVPFSSQINIAALNAATTAPDTSTVDIARFTQECILCGSCVPVCPVDNHRDLLMVSLKQRQGTLWESEVD
ncbi:MAG: FAD-dependent oxidoreductase, partial [Ktedonobacteraceae bacterium]|nr:FAD-dependent oxidoreductase [Ktedonobacteraceae bacterium]